MPHRIKLPRAGFGVHITDKPIEQALPELVRSGFSHIEIDIGAPVHRLETWTDKRINNVTALTEKHGVTLSIHTPHTMNLAECMPTVQFAQIEYHHNAIRLAAQLKAKWMTLHLGFYNGLASWKWYRSKTLEHLIHSLKEIMQWSKLYSVPIAIENMRSLPENGEFFYLGDNIGDLQWLMQRVTFSNFHLCLDLAAAAMGEGVQKYLKTFSNRITLIRVRDTSGIVDDSKHTPLIKWKQLTDALISMNYSGTIVLETYSVKPLLMYQRFVDYLEKGRISAAHKNNDRPVNNKKSAGKKTKKTQTVKKTARKKTKPAAKKKNTVKKSTRKKTAAARKITSSRVQKKKTRRS